MSACRSADWRAIASSMKGIDQNIPEKTQSLKVFHGETFSGLHLLCLMYVGFQLILSPLPWLVPNLFTWSIAFLDRNAGMPAP
jgi:hypothetical protein